MFIPSYIETHRCGKLFESIKKAYGILENCCLCPRECEVNSYPEKARGAIKEMHRRVGDLTLDENGIALRGILLTRVFIGCLI